MNMPGSSNLPVRLSQPKAEGVAAITHHEEESNRLFRHGTTVSHCDIERRVGNDQVGLESLMRGKRALAVVERYPLSVRGTRYRLLLFRLREWERCSGRS